MSEASRACPLCGTPLEMPDGASRVTCAICSSVVVLENGELVLETDLKRRKRRGGAEPSDVEQTSPDAPFEQQTLPDVPIGQQTSPDVPVEQQTSPDVPVEQQTSPDVPVETDVTSPGLPPPPDLETALPATASPLDAHGFQGSLKDLSIIDVLQLLYSSQKTGVLELTGPGIKASITLLEGQIIGCEHPTQGTQIGKTLVDMGAVTDQDVDEALAKQNADGSNRLPLVSTLIAMGKIDEAAGWQALEKLVESTVVNVLGWLGGTFVFEVADVTAFDDFRHMASGVAKVGLDTQTTLLETLKAMDEHGDDDGDLDATILDGLDAAFAESAPESITAVDEPEAVAVTTVELDDADVEELDHDTEEIAVAPPKPRELPVPIARALERIRQTPPKILAAAGGGLLLLIVIIIVVSVSGPDEPEATDNTVADTIADADPTGTDPTETPEPEIPEPTVGGPEPEPVVGADPSLDDPSKVKRKRKRKRKRKTKGAGSLFDVGVKK